MDKNLELVKSINNLPSELIDIIMNYYWSDIYKETIKTINSNIFFIDKILNFIFKFIISDCSRIYGNFHLHYYFYKYNSILENIIKDKGLYLLLKKYCRLSVDRDTFTSPSDPYLVLDQKIRYLAIASLCLSNSERYILYHNFRKFN